MRGRKPTPTPLKLLQGNPGKREVNQAEPRPPARLPRAPAGMSEAGKRAWRRFGRQLTEVGVMTTLDAAALRLLVDAWTGYLEAAEQLADAGQDMVIHTPSGYPVINPLISIANKKLSQVQSLLAEFGMTPSSRGRVVATDPGDRDGPRGIRRLTRPT